MRRFAVIAIAATLGLGVLTGSAAAGPTRLEGEWIVMDRSDYSTGIGEIFIMRPDGSELTNLTNGAAEDTDGELSPDGTVIAFTSNGPDGARVWLMSVDGSDRAQLTEFYGAGPTWTPDGLTVVYVGADGIRAIGRDGTGDRLITTVSGSLANPSVSPDGTSVVFDAFPADDRFLFTAPLAGGDPTQITVEGGFEPEWSPDGTRILFTTFRGEYGDNIFSTNPDGSEQENLVPSPENDFHASWSPDGSRIVFESVQAVDHTISIYDRVDGTTEYFLPVPIEGDTPAYRRPTWTAVTLDAVVMAMPDTTTTTSPTDTTTTVVEDTTTTLAPDPDTPVQKTTDWLVIGLAGAILALTAFGLGVIVGGRTRDQAPPPPPPPAT